jgi:transposase InsO family protein
MHTDRGSQFRSRKLVQQLNRHQMVGSMGRVGATGDNAAILQPAAEERPQPQILDHPRGTAHRDRDLD